MKSFVNIAVPPDRRLRSGSVSLPGSPDLAEEAITRAPVAKRAHPSVRSLHRFDVGEWLTMAGGGRITTREASTCLVLAHLPHEGGSLRYRVQSQSEGFQRVVNESDLSELAVPETVAV